MNRAKRIVLSFLNSAEGYFHTQTIIEDAVKQPRTLYGPMSSIPEGWNYTDIRDITACDLQNILKTALQSIDFELYKIIPSVALNAALQSTIHNLDFGKFQSKINSSKYNFLLNALSEEAGKGGIKQ